MSQEQIHKQKQEAAPQKTEAVSTEPKDLRNAELSQDVTDILDEIDAVLEVNAEEFVKAFVQKGGE